LTEEQRLKEIYQELQEYIMDQAAIIPSREIVGWNAMDNSVKGYDVNLQDHPYWYQVWVE
jgi:ABC-type transport system substrate-binding protein